MNSISEVNQKSGIPIEVLCKALQMPRATYYRHQGDDRPVSGKKQPANALGTIERQQILDLLHGERFVDKTPYEVFNTLIDTGEYYCSPRTMYRILSDESEIQDRRAQRSHRDAIKPELIATRPNEVWSWDITKLRSDKKWVYFYLYVLMDIFSRYVVGWLIADRESKELARQLIQKSALRQGIQPHQLTLHADNGPSMTSQTVSQMLDKMGIIKTHSRPYVSNDNPFSEAQFKTLKYCPTFPGKFSEIHHAEQFCKTFFPWYNHEHYHSGIVWLTPEMVHYGRAEEVLEERHQTLLKAYVKNQVRFNHKEPKLKQLPPTVYINPPQTVQVNLQNVVNINGQNLNFLTG